MYIEEIHETEDVYVIERPKMVTVRVQVSDFVPEEEQHIALPGPQQQFPDDFVVAAKPRKASGRTVTIPKAVAQAAARVSPDMKAVRVQVRKPR